MADPEVAGTAANRHPPPTWLRRKRVYEFALVVEPLKIAGGTGSTVTPIAIRLGE